MYKNTGDESRLKDYIKINHVLDMKANEKGRQRIELLQNQGLYPKSFLYPITLQFELTGKCNLACKHCYNRSGDQDRQDTTYMTPDKWRTLAKEIVNDGGIFQCIISGGEPLLLGEDLFEIMDILHDDGTSFVMITNGLLLTKEKVNKLRKYRFFWFQISIDGHSPEIHDPFRGVNGSWQNAVNGAMEISNAGLPLVIAHSVTPDNLPHLEEMVHLAYQLGANSIILGDILPSGRAVSNSNLLLTPEQKNYLYKMIDELSKAYQGKIQIERSAGLKTQMGLYTGRPNSGGIIRPNGDFRLDCMAPFIIGNVLKTPLKQLWQEKGITAWQSPLVQEYIASIHDDGTGATIRNHVDRDIIL